VSAPDVGSPSGGNGVNPFPYDHARREQRLREIMDELESMTDWKKP
jgi:hypothetical protein